MKQGCVLDNKYRVLCVIIVHLADISDSEINSRLASVYGLPNGTLFRLENFDYRSDALTNITFGHLSNTSFNGITVILSSYIPKL